MTKRRTKDDFAHCMRGLADDYFSLADKMRLFLDNLNIHTPVALYEIVRWKRPGGYCGIWSFMPLPNMRAG